MQIGGLCRAMTITDVARLMHLDWHTVKALDKNEHKICDRTIKKRPIQKDLPLNHPENARRLSRGILLVEIVPPVSTMSFRSWCISVEIRNQAFFQNPCIAKQLGFKFTPAIRAAFGIYPSTPI
jgi:hypothetical protein